MILEILNTYGILDVIIKLVCYEKGFLAFGGFKLSREVYIER